MSSAVTPTGSLARLLAGVLRTGLCSGCGACAGTCPYLVTLDDRVVGIHDCTLDTGHCVNACPRMSPLDLDGPGGETRATGEDQPIGAVRAAFKARAAGAGDRARGQNGGAVTALLAWGVESGRLSGALVAAGTILEPEAKVARTGAEVRAAAGTKYGMVPLLASLHRLQGTGTMATVALPCQALAMDRLASPAVPHPVERPLVLGLLCTWALDARALRRQVRTVGAGRAVTRLDVTPPPSAALEIGFDGGTPYAMPLDEARKLIRPACRTCDDMTAESSDLSIGTWEPDPVWNLVLLRTDRGEAFWRAAVEAGVVESTPVPLAELAGLEGAAAGKRRRAQDNARRMRADGLDVPYFAEVADV